MEKIITIIGIGMLISASLFAGMQPIEVHSENISVNKKGSVVNKFLVNQWQVSLADTTIYYDTPSENQVIIDETWQNQDGLEWHQIYQMSETDYFNATNQKSIELYRYLQAHSN